MSFLIFAAFIILLTWVFQTTLLRVFLAKETEDDLRQIGEQVCAYIRPRLPFDAENIPQDGFWERLQDENMASDIYLLDESGTLLYSTEPEENGIDLTERTEPIEAGAPNDAIFSEVSEDVQGKGTVVKVSDEYYLYAHCMEDGLARDGQISDLYVFVGYSAQLSHAAMGTMRVQLFIISIIVILLALVVSAWLSTLLTKPIIRITKAAQRLATGDFSVNFKSEYSYAEIDALAETLDYAKEEIERSDQLQKEVLANVTHDLKTPLTMIKAYASMIQEISGDNPEKRAKHTQVIIDESDRLTSLVNDILDLSKIRSGMDMLKITNFNFSEFVHTVLERFDYLTETQGYTVERDIDDELYAEADIEKMEQVVYNLVGNAVNYTGADKVIRVRLKRSEGGMLRLSVSDTGKGIPPEEIDTIWDRYYRSAETHKRPVKGTGLGLSIVKVILVKHGFPFGIESEVGKGSTFYFELPEK